MKQFLWLVLLVAACGGGGVTEPPPVPAQPQPPPPVQTQRTCAAGAQLCALNWDTRPLNADSTRWLLTVRFWNEGPACLRDVEAHAFFQIDSKDASHHIIRSTRDMPLILWPGMTEAVVGGPTWSMDVTRVVVVTAVEVPCV